MLQIVFSTYLKVDTTRAISSHMKNPLRYLITILNLKLQKWILNTSWKKTLFRLYKTPVSGIVTIIRVFTSEICDENHAFIWLKYHMKGQTRSQHLLNMAKKSYYKSLFNNLKYMNDLKQFTVPCVTKIYIFISINMVS